MEEPPPVPQKPPVGGIEEELMAESPLAGWHPGFLCTRHDARLSQLLQVGCVYAIAAQRDQVRLGEGHADDRGHFQRAALGRGQGVDASPQQCPQAERHAPPYGAGADSDALANLLEPPRLAQAPHDFADEEGVSGGPLVQPAGRFGVECGAGDGRAQLLGGALIEPA